MYFIDYLELGSQGDFTIKIDLTNSGEMSFKTTINSTTVTERSVQFFFESVLRFN
jgi:hypothetical protein